MPPPATYLDYAATTPTDPQVVEAMLPWFTERFGNPSSVHRWGQMAEQAVEDSRRIVSEEFGCRADEVIFTSGGSESDNLALRGAAHAARAARGADHLLISPVEHDAVLHTAEQLAEHEGFELELLPVDAYGQVAPQDLTDRIRPSTALVSIIYGNNEIGTLNDIEGLAAVTRERGVPFHSDALQTTSQLKVKLDQSGLDMLSIGAHKFYGPKGVGALIVRSGTSLTPLQTGGSQERGARAGTSNVSLIVGLAEAVRLAGQRREADSARFRELRDRIIQGVIERVLGAKLTGHPTERLANHCSFVIEGIDGNELLAALDLAGFACSSGSACKTGDPEPSQVLLAVGLEPQLSLGSLRVTVGRHSTDDEVRAFLVALPKLVERLRSSQPIPQ